MQFLSFPSLHMFVFFCTSAISLNVSCITGLFIAYIVFARVNVSEIGKAVNTTLEFHSVSVSEVFGVVSRLSVMLYLICGGKTKTF